MKLQTVDTQIQLVLHPLPPSTSSQTELGSSLWDACRVKYEGVEQSLLSQSQEPIFDTHELGRLAKAFEDPANPNRREHVWVALVTQRLTDIVSTLRPSKVLVNSEKISWIRTSSQLPSNYQAPDLFVCDPVAVLEKNPPAATESSESVYTSSIRESHFKFGECAWPLRDAMLCFMEAKVKISLFAALGEIFQKAQNLLSGTNYSADVKCCLFDLTTMYLLTFTSTGLQSSRKFKLTAAGSLKKLVEFLLPDDTVESKWLRTLRQLCTHFKVTPVQGSAFLGCGAHGKVFRVQKQADSTVGVYSLILPSETE